MDALAHGALPHLPDLFPIFPLSGALLLPQGRLPLNIFEPRYLAMTEDALGAGRHIAMIQPNPAGPHGATGPALHRVGCLGRLTSFAETDDGRYLITLGGIIRFVVTEEIGMERGYRRVRGDYEPFIDDLLRPEADSIGDIDRPALIEALKGYFAHHRIDANWAALEQMSDLTVMVTLSMGCPFAALEKQALLEAPTLQQRAETLIALLRIDAHQGDMPLDRKPS